MSQLEEIRERLDLCDKKIVSVLEERMDIIKEIMVYKKENGLPILQPEQEKRQRKMLLTHVDENTYKDEILEIFTYIVENSRRIQAKTLFTHNILLIGFMGAGKSTVSTYLSKILASPQVEMDEEIVKKEGMSINKIFEEYGETYFRNCETNLLIENQKKNYQNPAVIVDANHANSGKKYLEQIRICNEVLHSCRHSKEIASLVKGFMIESYIEDGAQKIGEGVYGRSITDPCLGWEKSERLIYDIADQL